MESNFNSRLFLWDESGTPLLANEGANGLGDAILTDSGNAINFGLTVSNEASSVTLTEGGTYVLSISTTGSEPLDTGDQALFDFSSAGSELVGPDASVGSFDAWRHDAGTTIEPYTIAMRGVRPVAIPEPSMTTGFLVDSLWRARESSSAAQVFASK